MTVQYNNTGSSSSANKLPSQRPSEICRRSSTIYTDSSLTLLSLAVAKGLTDVVSLIVVDGAMVTTMDAVRKSPMFFVLSHLIFFYLFCGQFFNFIVIFFVFFISRFMTAVTNL